MCKCPLGSSDACKLSYVLPFCVLYFVYSHVYRAPTLGLLDLYVEGQKTSQPPTEEWSVPYTGRTMHRED